jgi:DNA-binding MarR family transcriptional regulator
MNQSVETTDQWIEEVNVVAALISFSYRSIQKHFAKELAAYNIGWGHFAILMSLFDEEGRSQDNLAQSRGFDKTMITKSIAKLEQEGFVKRIVDLEDKRIKRLYLTNKGRVLEPELKRIGFTINKLLLANLDTQESRAALEGVRKIALNAAKLP